MNWIKEWPNDSGYYWLVELDKDPCIVEVRNEGGKRTVLRIGDTRQYPIEVWSKALWCGPLNPC